MRLSIRANLHKSLCGLLVALALVILPLPALADDAQQTNDAANASANGASANPAPAISVSTPALSLAVAAPGSDSSSLQSAPEGGATTPSVSIATPRPVESVQDSTTPATAAHVETNINSTATSGDAAVTDNRRGGDAASGNATSTATVVNVANTNGSTAGSFSAFECNVTQDTQENLVIDPSSLLPICQSTNAGTTQPTASTGGIQTGASLTDILNNIVLSATSGNANVDGNRTAGNAASGNATALANIVNIANSSISAKKSFLGVINIYGTLTGDILVPQSLVDGLVGSGGSVPGANSNATTITNALNASATSGNATVADNRTGGDATSGDAMTSMTVMNLTGQEVIAKNSLLVFVNVLGKWMGLIVPAPGTKTALLGSGVQSSAAAPAGGLGGGDVTTNIINNISVQAQSGDASVTNNRKAGDATSGKASAGINVLNITNSNFRLDDWFGAIFINVLGKWIGDFNIQAAATSGNPPKDIVKAVQVYQFTAPASVKPVVVSQSVSTSSTSSGATRSSTIDNITDNSTPAGVVLGTSTTKVPSDEGGNPHSPTFDIIALGAIVSALTLLIAGGSLAIRHWQSA